LLLSSRQAAAALAISPRALHELRMRGELTPIRLPGRGIAGRALYQRKLDDRRCPVTVGRRLIPEDYVPVVEAALRRLGRQLSELRQ
jgi:hypothetical protein